MSKRKVISLLIASALMLMLFSSFAVYAESPDLTISPRTEAEMESDVISGLGTAIKSRLNEREVGEWFVTSYTVKISFANYTDSKIKPSPSHDGSFDRYVKIFSLDIFDEFGDSPEYDYEFLVLKGGIGEPSTFSISFENVMANGSGEITEMSITYKLAWGESKAQTEAVTEFCRGAVAEKITSGMSDYEKIKALHDFVTSEFQYATEELAADNRHVFFPIYMITNGKGVCQAYTAVFLKLMEVAGLKNSVIAVRHDSSADGGGHAWNLVKIGSGWFHLDTTWDDTGRGTRYTYFLRSDSGFSRDHSWRAGIYPAAPADYTAPSSSVPASSAAGQSSHPQSSAVTPSQPQSSEVQQSQPQSSHTQSSQIPPQSSDVGSSSLSSSDINQSSDITQPSSISQSSELPTPPSEPSQSSLSDIGSVSSSEGGLPGESSNTTSVPDTQSGEQSSDSDNVGANPTDYVLYAAIIVGIPLLITAGIIAVKSCKKRK